MSQGRQLVTTGSDGLVKLWNLREEECVKTLDGHVEKVSFSQTLKITAKTNEFQHPGLDSRHLQG